MKQEFQDKIKDLSNAAARLMLEIVSESFIEGAAGAVVTGVGNVILSY